MLPYLFSGGYELRLHHICANWRAKIKTKNFEISIILPTENHIFTQKKGKFWASNNIMAKITARKDSAIIYEILFNYAIVAK